MSPKGCNAAAAENFMPLEQLRGEKDDYGEAG